LAAYRRLEFGMVNAVLLRTIVGWVEERNPTNDPILIRIGRSVIMILLNVLIAVIIILFIVIIVCVGINAFYGGRLINKKIESNNFVGVVIDYVMSLISK